jgi:hypothetical protein
MAGEYGALYPLAGETSAGMHMHCRADADDMACQETKPGYLLYALATATAPDCIRATKLAKQDAIHTLAMKPKHVNVDALNRGGVDPDA